LTDDHLSALNGKHTIFGFVAEGLEVLDKLNKVYIDDDNKPMVNIRIFHTVVLDDPFDDPEGLVVPGESPELVVNVSTGN
jgi:peptidyl-prolyl cis-trans isomerase-like 4